MRVVRASALALTLALGSAGAMIAQPAAAQVFVGVSVQIAPPPLPIYTQPPPPDVDYMWAPGYWAWDADYGDYYWVPGAWVLAPEPGLLWTPGYWGWNDGLYVFHTGYWGRTIGFYGGVNYGFGYTGAGFFGGYWNGPHFFYNRSVTNVTNVNITNVYNKTVVVNQTNVTRVSFNGGPSGVQAAPTAEQAAAAREQHVQPTPAQVQQRTLAQSNRGSFASVNHGAPPVAATVHAGQFNGPGVVKARNAPNPQVGASRPQGLNPGGPMQRAPGAPGTRPLGFNPGGPMQRAPGVQPGEPSLRPQVINPGGPMQRRPGLQPDDARPEGVAGARPDAAPRERNDYPSSNPMSGERPANPAYRPPAARPPAFHPAPAPRAAPPPRAQPRPAPQPRPHPEEHRPEG